MDKPMRRRVRGIAVIWLVVTAVVLIGMVGLATDTAYVYWVAHELQTAADASALAGALYVGRDAAQAEQAALNFALANTAGGQPVLLTSNGANDPAGDIVIGRYDSATRTFTATVDSPNAVQVTARRTMDSPGGGVPLFFGHIFGVSTVNVTRSAVAMTNNKAPGLIVLDPNHTEGSLNFGVGKIVLNVEGGTIAVNSSDPKAVLCNVNVQIIATELNIVGGYHGLPGEPLPIIHTGVTPPAAADPLEGLAVPPNGPVRTIPTDGSQTLAPGYYPGGIWITPTTVAGKTWTFQPGIYVVDHRPGDIKAVSIGAGCIVNGDGVIIVVKTGSLNIGDSTVNFTPPASGTYAGISFFQPPDNTTLASIGGHSHVSGMIYLPHAQANIGGSATDYYATQIICYRLKLSDAIHISVPLGPRAGGTVHCFLVK